MESSFAPVAVSTGEPLRLAMQRLWLTGQVLPVGGRLVVQHVFRSDEARPLEVIYAFPLPRDAALRAFRIVGDGFEAHSELKQTEDAVKSYEKGIADGSLSALARQYGDGLINLTVGNVRPGETVTVYLELLAGVELRDDGFRFRFPFTLAPAYHSRMRVAADRGEGEIELPSDEFGDLILPRFRQDASSLHEVGFELSLLNSSPVAEIGSPSHAIRVRQNTVSLAREKDVPNRDLVLDVKFQESKAQVLAGPTGEGKHSFAAVIPSTLFGRCAESPRRIVMLLDRSGSMQGAPIAQARKAIEACLAALTEQDSFGLVAFDNEVEAMSPALVLATRQQRERARAFLKQADARGGTELAAGVQQAAQVLGGEGDVLIITDGQVFGTETILAQARAAGIRLSCLGIGSASQDRFLTQLARDTGGVGRFVTAQERVDLSAVELFASMGRPVATGLRAGANVQPDPPRSVFAGTPVVVYGEGDSRVELTWDGGRMDLDVPPGDPEMGAVVRLLRGSRLITDCQEPARLIELSKMYGLASREMSLVAVVKRPGDRSGELPETRVVPVGMPEDVSFQAYFRKPTGHVATMATCAMPPTAPVPAQAQASYVTGAARSRWSFGGFGNLFDRASTPSEPPSKPDLMDLAGMLEPDGGMPGADPAARAARTIAAVLAFVAEGHTLTSGAFRLHVTRLAGFLKSLSAASDKEAGLIKRALDAAAAGTAPPGRWLELAAKPDTRWKQIEKAGATS